MESEQSGTGTIGYLCSGEKNEYQPLSQTRHRETISTWITDLNTQKVRTTKILGEKHWQNYSGLGEKKYVLIGNKKY